MCKINDVASDFAECLLCYVSSRRLCTSNHMNLVQWYGSFCHRIRSQEERLILVTELCDTSLRDLIADEPTLVPASNRIVHSTVQDTTAAFLFSCDMGKQVAEGLRFIHNKNYVHRDLKLENVLVRTVGSTVRKMLPMSSNVNPNFRLVSEILMPQTG